MGKSTNKPFIEIGNRLKAFAESEYGSIKGLAVEIGISLQSISQYINGRNSPGQKLLSKLIKANCDIHWLLTGRRTENPSESFNGIVREYQIMHASKEVHNLHRRIEELEEENRLLRDKCSQIALLAQAVEIKKE